MEQDPKEKDQKPEDNKEIARMQILKNLDLEEDAVLVLEEDQEGLEEEMPRPCKKRRVHGQPNSFYFKPAGIKKIDLEEIRLFPDEFEAIRLIDLEEISQIEAGERMQISQSTLSRILKSGRKKISGAIVKGKSIKIEK
jgi:predicted DNA-binding protein (UPF0251 family)